MVNQGGETVKADVLASNPDTSQAEEGVISQYSLKDSDGREALQDTAQFSLKSPVEEKDLIALHNLNAKKLEKVLALGGFPMPSIAVTRTEIPHTNFRNITLVMNKATYRGIFLIRHISAIDRAILLPSGNRWRSML